MKPPARRNTRRLGRVETLHDFDFHDPAALHATEEGHEGHSPKQEWSKLSHAVSGSLAFKKVLSEKHERRGAIIWAAAATIAAGCISYVPFELLNKADRGCADLILLAQYVYAAGECLFSGSASEFVLERKIPFAFHLVILLLERGRNFMFNSGLNMGLPMPVYLVVKNSGLVVSMVLGFGVQQKKYSTLQALGVFAITLGVIAATFASRPAPKADAGQAKGIEAGSFMLATGLMVAGVVTTSLMNIAQESTFSRYGKHFQETMFYSNILGLPLFLLNMADIASHARTWSTRWEPLPLPAPLDVPVPMLWLLVLLNIAAQSVMKVSCMKLTALAGQVSNVVAVTVFRFVCLVISAVLMNSPPFPPLSFWVGGLLTLGGTLAYVLAPHKQQVKKE